MLFLTSLVINCVLFALVLPRQHTTMLSSSKSAVVTVNKPPSKKENASEPNDIEKIAGFVSGSYTCVCNSVNGTLWAGSSALYFVGTFFLFEKKLVIPWERIRQVQKLDQGVAIITKDETVHSFSSIHAPARVWVILVSLHNDALLDHPGNRAKLMSPHHRHRRGRHTMKRRNSDPPGAAASMDAAELDSYDGESGDGIHNPIDDVAETRGAAAESSETEKETRAVANWFANLMEPKVTEVEIKVGVLKMLPLRSTYRGHTGKLYVGNLGFFFYGKRLFWEQKQIFIRFNAIRQFQIQGKENQRKRCGISIITKEGEVYDFRDMEQADRVWASLIALQNENLTSGTDRPERFTLRRMNSDPLMPSQLSFDHSSEEVVETESDGPASDALETKAVVPFVSLADEWAAEVARKKDYANLVVKGQSLRCSMHKFYDLFIADGAPHSIAKFLEGRGDSNLTVSDWARDASKETRVIHYKHPVNAPLAPPVAGARKEQAFRRYGDYGLCLETRTIVDDVPMADCFYVSDRVRVAPKGKDSVSVTVEFDITFIKSTMFKSIIGKTTASEFTKLCESRK
jgi:hypothetical protein